MGVNGFLIHISIILKMQRFCQGIQVLLWIGMGLVPSQFYVSNAKSDRNTGLLLIVLKELMFLSLVWLFH
jgi:hypothetical protein